MTDDTKPWPHGLDLIADNPVTCKHNGVYYEDANTKVCLYCGVKVLASETKPESANGREKAMCPKCGSISGDDWTQCGGSCPMPISPHYKKPNDTKPESASERERPIQDVQCPQCGKKWKEDSDDDLGGEVYCSEECAYPDGVPNETY